MPQAPEPPIPGNLGCRRLSQPCEQAPESEADKTTDRVQDHIVDIDNTVRVPRYTKPDKQLRKLDANRTGNKNGQRCLQLL